MEIVMMQWKMKEILLSQSVSKKSSNTLTTSLIVEELMIVILGKIMEILKVLGFNSSILLMVSVGNAPVIGMSMIGKVLFHFQLQLQMEQVKQANVKLNFPQLTPLALFVILDVMIVLVILNGERRWIVRGKELILNGLRYVERQ